MTQPHIPQQPIIPLLMQEKLPVAPQPGVNLTVFVKIRYVRPGAIAVVEVEDGTFADVDEEACFGGTSRLRGILSVHPCNG